METKKIYRINGKLFVAGNIHGAIRMFEQEYPFPNEVETVELVKDGDGCSLARVEEYENLRTEDDGYNYRDCCVDPNYIDSITLADEPHPIPTGGMEGYCKELSPDFADFIVRDEEPQGNFTAKKEVKADGDNDGLPF